MELVHQWSGGWWKMRRRAEWPWCGWGSDLWDATKGRGVEIRGNLYGFELPLAWKHNEEEIYTTGLLEKWEKQLLESGNEHWREKNECRMTKRPQWKHMVKLMENTILNRPKFLSVEGCLKSSKKLKLGEWGSHWQLTALAFLSWTLLRGWLSRVPTMYPLGVVPPTLIQQLVVGVSHP